MEWVHPITFRTRQVAVVLNQRMLIEGTRKRHLVNLLSRQDHIRIFLTPCVHDEIEATIP